MKGRKVLLSAAFLILLAGIIAFFALTSSTPDKFTFLQGRRPTMTFLMEVIDTTYEVRVYTWDDDYEKLKEAVRREMDQKGFTFNYEDKGAKARLNFSKGSGYFGFGTGRVKTVDDLIQNKFTPGGVTCYVAEKLPKGFLTEVRRKLQKPIDPFSEQTK